MDKFGEIRKEYRDKLSTEYFKIVPTKPELVGESNVEILNKPEGSVVFLKRENGKSLVVSGRGDVVVEGVSNEGLEAVRAIVAANAEQGMQEVKRALTKADILTWENPT